MNTSVAESFYDENPKLDKGWLQIEGHLLLLEHKLIQISNIERVAYWVEELPEEPDIEDLLQRGRTMRNRGFLALLIGVALIPISNLFAKIPVVGQTLRAILAFAVIILLAVGGYMVWQGFKDIADAESEHRAWQKAYDDAKNNRYLYIHLVSGQKYSIHFRRERDLNDALQTLAEVFKAGGKASKEYHWDVEVKADTIGNVITGKNARLRDTNIGN